MFEQLFFFSTELRSSLSLQDSGVPGHDVGEKSSSTDAEASVLPPKILTAAHLSSLRDLLTDKKITGEIFLLLL